MTSRLMNSGSAFAAVGRCNSRLLIGILAVALYCATPRVVGASCGNGVVEADEECDDGGICIGGVNAGTPCTAEAQCVGNGGCIGGIRPLFECRDDADCPGGRCVRCQTFGGDGCAVNCTREHDVRVDLVDGRVEGIQVVAGTGISLASAGVPFLSLAFNGSETFVVGAECNGRIPIAMRTRGVGFNQLPSDVCVCVRGIALQTCGGTLFDLEGMPSGNCTPGFMPANSTCPDQQACAFVHGPGNAASGVVDCDGGTPSDLSIVQDCATPAGRDSQPAHFELSGGGAPGSALVFTSTVLRGGGITCYDPTDNSGPDHWLCTDDDPPPSSATGLLTTGLGTTGSVTSMQINVDDTPGAIRGPFLQHGRSFDCAALENGESPRGALVSAAPVCDVADIGDTNLLTQVVQVGAPTPTQTGTPTLAPTPTLTATPLPCGGDCNGDGMVSIDEIITAVNIDLENAPLSRCPSADVNGDGQVAIDDILAAVNHALNGC